MAPSKPSIHYKYIHVSMMLNADGNDVENEDNNLMIINKTKLTMKIYVGLRDHGFICLNLILYYMTPE